MQRTVSILRPVSSRGTHKNISSGAPSTRVCSVVKWTPCSDKLVVRPLYINASFMFVIRNCSGTARFFRGANRRSIGCMAPPLWSDPDLYFVQNRKGPAEGEEI